MPSSLLGMVADRTDTVLDKVSALDLSVIRDRLHLSAAPSSEAGLSVFSNDISDMESPLLGGDAADTLTGGSGDDLIMGGGGDDILRGQAADDMVLGNEGNDFLYGGDGNDMLDGGAGFDTLHGGEGDDVIDVGAGRDALNGNAGSDLLDGASGADQIVDFQNEIDTLVLDRSLVGGCGISVSALGQYAAFTAEGMVLDFGYGNMMTLDGVSSINVLNNDLEFV